MRYEISRQALAVIDEIIEYTNQNFGEGQTADYVGGLFTSFQLMADNPSIGKAWQGNEKRVYIYRSHYVFYRQMADHVFITDIRNTRQQIPGEWNDA